MRLKSDIFQNKTKCLEKLSNAEWMIFVVMISLIFSSFLISRIKVSVIKVKNSSQLVAPTPKNKKR